VGITLCALIYCAYCCEWWSGVSTLSAVSRFLTCSSHDRLGIRNPSR
jgi:hypothetical protein